MANTIRMRFSKQGRAKYISHLDLMRCLQRAICRAELPASYSGGFHPHMATSFAITLPLGFTSTAEILELGLEEALSGETVMARLNEALPSEIHIEEVAETGLPFKALAYGDYVVSIPCETPETLLVHLEALLSQETILTEKKTKKGIKEVDIKPDIQLLSAEKGEDYLRLLLRLSTGSSKNVNPTLLLHALEQKIGFSLSQPEICRIGLLTDSFEKFF